MGRFFRKLALVLAILIGAGLVKVPVEHAVRSDLRDSGFHPKRGDVSVLDQVGVQSFIGVLGGLRYMVATGLTLKAIGLWSEYRWAELEETYRLIHLLQPDDVDAWSFGAWQMAYNASAYYLYDDEKNPPAVREKLAEYYVERGAEMLREGIRWNPDAVILYRDLGMLYREKYDDHCAAAEVYRTAMKLDAAPSYLRRFYVYSLAQCEGKEEEAYEAAMALYEQGKRVLKNQGVMIWTPSLIQHLKDLEEKLDVPEDQRIPESLDPQTMKINTPIRS